MDMVTRVQILDETDWFTCSPWSNFQNFLFAFWHWLLRSTITTRWNSSIFSVQKIWSPSFLLATSLILSKSTYFYVFNLILHAQQVVSLFGNTYYCEQLFSKMKYTKSTLHLQQSNHHLSDRFLLTSSFNPDITSFCDYKHQMSHFCRYLLSRYVEVFSRSLLCIYVIICKYKFD